MITFKYSFISKLIYRYANIPATLFLALYLVSSFSYMFQQWYYLFPFLLNLLIIIVLNRHYFRSYKLFPYRIDINTEKMICSDYFNRNKIVEINLQDIDLIEGGSLYGTPGKPILVHNSVNDVVVGISPHMKNHNKLITIILSNVKEKVYNDVLSIAKELSNANKELLAKSKKDKKKPTNN
ncbi:MAG: hypothetical protein L3J41_06655 [Melioribacteraceae bacterium]|nr:hypothetical protein [Melioribacteraceae bacterium]